MVNFLTISTLIAYASFAFYFITKWCKTAFSIIVSAILLIILGFGIIFGLNIMVGYLGNHPVLFTILFFMILIRVVLELIGGN